MSDIYRPLSLFFSQMLFSSFALYFSSYCPFLWIFFVYHIAGKRGASSSGALSSGGTSTGGRHNGSSSTTGAAITALTTTNTTTNTTTDTATATAAAAATAIITHMDVVDTSDTAAVAGAVGVASLFFIDRDKVLVNGSGSSSSGVGTNCDSTGDHRSSTATAGDDGDDDIMCVVGTGINVNDPIGVLEWPWMRVLDALRVHHGIRCRSLS